MYLVDYHTHPYGHGEGNFSSSYLEEFIKNAKKRGINELGFSDHDQYLEEIEWKQLIAIKENTSFKIKLGLEFDFFPGIDNKLEKVIKDYPLDYSIVSVHFIDNWGFDNPTEKEGYQEKDVDMLYEKYYNLIQQAVSSNLFDIVGHLDLIKVFNFFPQKKEIINFVRPVLQQIKKNGLVVEINTNGINKPVGEMYPSLEIIKIMEQMQIPITLGSDAHLPERTGENLKKAVQIAFKIGYRYIVSFSNHKKTFKKIM